MVLNKTNFSVDKDNNTIKVTRTFNAPLAEVWKAWTDSEVLDQWWAPKPWKAETQKMDFREGGSWLYCMVGPEGERHYGKNEYVSIEKNKSFKGIDFFCDEKGNKIADLPNTNWSNTFSATDNGTLVEIQLTFATLDELEKLVAMGFQEGFAMAHENLDQLLNTKK